MRCSSGARARRDEETTKKKATPRPRPRSHSRPEKPKATPHARRDSQARARAECQSRARRTRRVRRPAASASSQLITSALALTKLNLTYIYGSADPAQGGMDCSGTMHHLLVSSGFQDVPRDSPGRYCVGAQSRRLPRRREQERGQL